MHRDKQEKQDKPEIKDTSWVMLLVVPVCLGLIIGVVGTAQAVAHGDWGAAVVCAIIGIAAVVGFLIGTAATSTNN